MVAQIEGQGRSAFPKLASIDAQNDSDTERDIKVSDKFHDVASALYQQMLGHRRSRLGWTDPAQLYDDGEENWTRSTLRFAFSRIYTKIRVGTRYEDNLIFSSSLTPLPTQQGTFDASTH